MKEMEIKTKIIEIPEQLARYCDSRLNSSTAMNKLKVEKNNELVMMMMHFINQTGQLGHNAKELKKVFNRKYRDLLDVLWAINVLHCDKEHATTLKFEDNISKIDRKEDPTIEPVYYDVEIYSRKYFARKDIKYIKREIPLRKLNAKVFNVIDEIQAKDSIWQYHKDKIRAIGASIYTCVEKFIKKLVKKAKKVVAIISKLPIIKSFKAYKEGVPHTNHRVFQPLGTPSFLFNPPFIENKTISTIPRYG